MSSSIDEQFVEYVVKSLVTKPDEVKVDRRIDEKGVLIELTVDPEDLGRVIGKRGATAQSIRTLLRALGTKNDARYNLKIVDNGVGGGNSNDRSDSRSYGNDGAWGDNSSKPSSSRQDGSANVADETTNSSDDAVARTRRELADLDDLDV